MLIEIRIMQIPREPGVEGRRYLRMVREHPDNAAVIELPDRDKEYALDEHQGKQDGDHEAGDHLQPQGAAAQPHKRSSRLKR